MKTLWDMADDWQISVREELLWPEFGTFFLLLFLFPLITCAFIFLFFSSGNKFIQVVDYSRFARPNIVRRQKTTAPAADIARCGFLVAWITRGVKITDPGTVHVWDMYRRVSKKWNLLCDAQGENASQIVINIQFKIGRLCSKVVI